MSAFTFPKSVNAIVEPQLLPEDWYLMRITEEPSIQPNKKKKDGGEDAEGAGDNLVIKLRVQHEDPLINGRAFTKYLPWPKPGDENEADRFTGQPLLDRKMEAIVAWVDAFGGEIGEEDFELNAGLEAYCLVVQETDMSGEKIVNNLDFNSLPKPV